MQLILQDDLISVSVTVIYHDQAIDIPNVVVDTGSASTVLSADILATIGIMPEPEDVLYTVRGIGGGEVVFARHVTALQVNEMHIPDFEVEVGGMDYGLPINGILGLDFLLKAGAIIDLSTLTIEFRCD